MVCLIPAIPLALMLFVRNVNPTASVKMGTASNHFPFIFNSILTVLFAVIVVLRRKTFTFRMSSEYV